MFLPSDLIVTVVQSIIYWYYKAWITTLTYMERIANVVVQADSIVQ
jgi:hypothetical protein